MTITQRQLLQEVTLKPDLDEACEKVGIKLATVKKWLQRDEAFGDAYDEIFKDSLAIAKGLMEGAAARATGVYEEALTATKIGEVDVQCTHCGEDFQTVASMPDWTARLKAAEIILKTSNILVDRRQIEQTTVHLTMEERLAIAAWKSGRPIPPNVQSKLEQRGLLTSSREEES